MTDEPNRTVFETIDGQPIDLDPVKQFRRWFEEAKAAGLPLPEAMTLATATPEGIPSARMVLLKQLDERGFVFFTNYRSAKAHELDINPYASLVFFWPQLERQVRIDGKVIRTSAEESRQYFETRPRESQIGAWASNQSEVISGREVLEQRKAELENQYLNRAVEWPKHWGGYILRPDRIEFWKGRIGRLHDRILYERELGNTWIIKRLAP
jgi:pyridoxamine 5'-phosphate oxidase